MEYDSANRAFVCGQFRGLEHPASMTVWYRRCNHDGNKSMLNMVVLVGRFLDIFWRTSGSVFLSTQQTNIAISLAIEIPYNIRNMVGHVLSRTSYGQVG